MQQTLLSLAALLIATLLSFNQLQASMQSQQQVVRAEMEQMALGVAMQTMEVIRARAFDAETADRSSENVADRSDLTPLPFSPGNDCEVFGGGDRCNDVDDFHRMDPATVPFELPDGALDFEVRAEVRYVTPGLEPAGGRTFGKEVILTVQDDPPNGQAPRLSDGIRYSQVITYP
jgi:hypothetical protein